MSAGSSDDRPVTEQDVLLFLLALADLPKREIERPAEAVDRYIIALEGVSVSTLQEAQRRVMRGEHGHKFFPHYVELKLLCDRIAAHHVVARRNAKRDPIEPPPIVTPEERERVALGFRLLTSALKRGSAAQAEFEAARKEGVEAMRALDARWTAETAEAIAS